MLCTNNKLLFLFKFCPNSDISCLLTLFLLFKYTNNWNKRIHCLKNQEILSRGKHIFLDQGIHRHVHVYRWWCENIAISSSVHWINNSNTNRPLALRGHVTNAPFKQWVGILMMPKSDRAHKNYLTPEIWEEMHLREIFYGTLIFQRSSIINYWFLRSC